jgi:class 3 adenylate cyclase
MAKVLLLSRDVPDPELEWLADSFEDEDGVSVEIYKPQTRGYRVTWWEVLLIYLGGKGADAVAGRALNFLLDVSIQKAKAWYADRVKKGARRPLSLILRDATGRLLRALELKPSGEVEDVSGEHKGARHVPPPDDEIKNPPGSGAPPTKLSKEKSRTTIIYCDIPGSTLLLSKTPTARFHEWLDQCRREWSAVVQMNRGFVFHSHRDNVAAYFPDSPGREDGADRATAAVLEIDALTKNLSTHRVLKRAKVRIGIASGVLSPYQLRPTTTLNRTCRLAAALSLVSRDDFIAVDDATRKLIAARFRVEDCGWKALPQLKSPVRFWRVLGRSG